MKVSELIEVLKTLPQDDEVFTNECEATSDHEAIVPLTTVECIGLNVFVGTGKPRMGVIVG